MMHLKKITHYFIIIFLLFSPQLIFMSIYYFLSNIFKKYLLYILYHSFHGNSHGIKVIYIIPVFLLQVIYFPVIFLLAS